MTFIKPKFNNVFIFDNILFTVEGRASLRYRRSITRSTRPTAARRRETGTQYIITYIDFGKRTYIKITLFKDAI